MLYSSLTKAKNHNVINQGEKMRASLVIMLTGLFSLTISCAHKNIEKKEQVVVKETVIEKPIAKKEADKKARSYSCLVGKDQRVITLDREAKRCEVHYTKHGERQQVAWAESTQDICDRAFNSIRSNIENDGFKCNDGDTAAIKNDKKEIKKPLETAQK